MIYVSYNNSYCSLRTLIRLSYKKKLGLDAQEMKPILLLDNIRSYVDLSTFFTHKTAIYCQVTFIETNAVAERLLGSGNTDNCV